jgi:hypothetical protein
MINPWVLNMLLSKDKDKDEGRDRDEEEGRDKVRNVGSWDTAWDCHCAL